MFSRIVTSLEIPAPSGPSFHGFIQVAQFETDTPPDSVPDPQFNDFYYGAGKALDRLPQFAPTLLFIRRGSPLNQPAATSVRLRNRPFGQGRASLRAFKTSVVNAAAFGYFDRRR